MANKSPNLGLNLTPLNEDAKLFVDWQNEQASDQQNSNMMIIDKTLGSAIEDIEIHESDTDIHIDVEERNNWDKKVDSTRKVNGKALNNDIALNAEDVGAPTKGDFEDISEDLKKKSLDIDRNKLSTTIYKETSSSSIARKINIPGITSLDDLLNIPIHISAAAYGNTSPSTLSINNFTASYIYFPAMTGSGLITTLPSHYWTRVDEVYTVYWNGDYFVCTNFSIRYANTSVVGIIQLSTSSTSTSATTAATSSALKSVNDKVTVLESKTVLSTTAPEVGTSSPYANGTLLFVYE